MHTYILCRAGEATYAVPSADVLHLELAPAIAPLPGAASFVEGVALVRGQAVPVVSLRLRMGLPARPHDLRSRLVVVRRGERTVGLLVDSAREFVRIPADAVQPPPAAPAEPAAPFLAGVFLRDNQLVLVLNTDALLTGG